MTGPLALEALVGALRVQAATDMNSNRIRVGFDVVDLERFALAVRRTGSPLLARIFTSGELDSSGIAEEQPGRLAAQFAVKEAVVKAIGGFRQGMAFTQIQVELRDTGAVAVKWSGTLSAWAQCKSVTIVGAAAFCGGQEAMAGILLTGHWEA